MKNLVNVNNLKNDKEITFADYIFLRLLDYDVNTVFGLTGGGIMYLIDSIYRNKDMNFVSVHHESYGGLAADAYSKVGNKIGVALGTTGPGVTNLFTSVAAAWQDSSKVLFIGGQVKSSDSSRLNNFSLRQNGTFEFDAIDAFKPITKFSEIISDPIKGISQIEDALRSISENKPGPAYIEVPLDIQGKKILIKDIKKIFSSKVKKTPIKKSSTIKLNLKKLDFSYSPLFLVGGGMMKSNFREDFKKFLKKYSLPYVVTPLALGFSCADDKNFMGMLSQRGNRSANIISQQANTIFVIGSSLHQQIVGWDPKMFNPDAKKIWFEIDKNLTDLRSDDLSIDQIFNLDIDESVKYLMKHNIDQKKYKSWISYCKKIKSKFLNHKIESRELDLYQAIDVLNEHIDKFSCISTDAGQPWYIVPQAFRLKEKNTFISSGSFGSMGMTIPYMVGSGQINLKKTVLGIIGDGSLMMCLSELSTLKTYLPNFLLVIVNNNGYRSIRGTHKKFFEGRIIGTDESNGVFIPNYEKISNSFELPYIGIRELGGLKKILKNFEKGQLIIELFTTQDQQIEPIVVSRMDDQGNFINTSLDDMFPYVEYEKYKS